MLRFQFSACHTFKKKWKNHICWEVSAWHEFICQRVKIIFFEHIKLVNIYKTIVHYTMEYRAFKTSATLPSLSKILSSPSLSIPLLSIPSLSMPLPRNTPPFVYQPNRNLLTLNLVYTFIKDRRISLMSEHTIWTQNN
jgi:hypothetical protein